MKKGWVLLFGLAVFSACNNTADLENKADSLGKAVDSAGQKAWDSGKKDVKELKERIEEKFKDKDSANQ